MRKQDIRRVATPVTVAVLFLIQVMAVPSSGVGAQSPNYTCEPTDFGWKCPTITVTGTMSIQLKQTYGDAEDTLTGQGTFGFIFVNQTTVCYSISDCGSPPSTAPYTGAIVNGSYDIGGTFTSQGTTSYGSSYACTWGASVQVSSSGGIAQGWQNSSGIFLSVNMGFEPGLVTTAQCTGGTTTSINESVGIYSVGFAPIDLVQGFSTNLGPWVSLGDGSASQSGTLEVDFTSLVLSPGSFPGSSSTTTATTTSLETKTSGTSIAATSSKVESTSEATSTSTCLTVGALGEGLCPPAPIADLTAPADSSVTNVITGASETSEVYIGDLIDVGNGVADLSCIGKGVCSTQLEAHTVAALLVAYPQDESNPGGPVAIGPDPASNPDLHAMYEALSTSQEFGSFWSKAVGEGFVTPEPLSEYYQNALGEFALEHVAGVVIDAVGFGAIHVLEKEGNQYLNDVFDQGIDLAPGLAVVHTGTEFTINAMLNGSSVQVFSGSVIAMSLTTGQITTVGAGSQLFVPSNPAQASSQNLSSSVESFNPSTALHWWSTSGGIPSFFLYGVGAAVVAGAVAFVYVMRKNPVRRASATVGQAKVNRT
jgi:hypothetical protein